MARSCTVTGMATGRFKFTVACLFALAAYAVQAVPGRLRQRKRGRKMAKRIWNSTPKKDGYRMPGEYEAQERIWMIWPEPRRYGHPTTVALCFRLPE